MGGFQTVVNTQPAPGIEGDFCNKNPRFSVDAGPGGLVAGDKGVVVGRFAWLSFEEVGHLMNCSEDAAKMLYHRALKALRDTVAAQEQAVE